MRASRTSARDMECKYTLKKEQHYLLVSPKDKDSITKKSSVIYWFRYDMIDCEYEYKGESSRMFEERYKEHLTAPSPILSTKSTLGTQHLWRISRS